MLHRYFALEKTWVQVNWRAPGVNPHLIRPLRSRLVLLFQDAVLGPKSVIITGSSRMSYNISWHTNHKTGQH